MTTELATELAHAVLEQARVGLPDRDIERLVGAIAEQLSSLQRQQESTAKVRRQYEQEFQRLTKGFDMPEEDCFRVLVEVTDPSGRCHRNAMHVSAYALDDDSTATYDAAARMFLERFDECLRATRRGYSPPRFLYDPTEGTVRRG